MAGIPHLIIDDFLPGEVHRGLLERALNTAEFSQGAVLSGGVTDKFPEHRRGLHSDDRLGEWLPPLRDAVHAAFPAICDALRTPRFKLAAFEILLVAHGDGDFYKAHRDTFIGSDRALTTVDRIITLVYYFHRQPKAFSGGELRLFPFSANEPLSIEPRDNRLIAFPSFVLHEVAPVTMPDRKFENSRFSVSCWLDRERPVSTAA